MLNVGFKNDIPTGRETISYFVVVANYLLHYEPTISRITPKYN